MKNLLNVIAVSILGMASLLNANAEAASLKQVQTRLTVFNVPQALYVKLSEDPNLQNPSNLRTALMSAVENDQATIQVIHEAVGKSGLSVIAGSYDELTYASAIQNGLPVFKTTKVEMATLLIINIPIQ
jgi:5-deoxy-D-glucuronate isomerase